MSKILKHPLMADHQAVFQRYMGLRWPIEKRVDGALVGILTMPVLVLCWLGGALLATNIIEPEGVWRQGMAILAGLVVAAMAWAIWRKLKNDEKRAIDGLDEQTLEALARDAVQAFEDEASRFSVSRLDDESQSELELFRKRVKRRAAWLLSGDRELVDQGLSYMLADRTDKPGVSLFADIAWLEPKLKERHDDIERQRIIAKRAEQGHQRLTALTEQKETES